MSTKAPTLRQFQDRFPTEDACLDHLFQVRYGADFECPGCARPAKFTRVKGRRSYQCQWCAHQVYPTAGTPFDRTRTPLRGWFYVMFMFCTTRKGVAAKKVERELGVTYKTAWRMCHMIREYMGALDGADPIGGIGTAVEADETYIGGVRPGKSGRAALGKTVVMGAMERGGDMTTAVVPNVRKDTLQGFISANVLPGGQLHTDELASYRGLHQRGYRHMKVNHGAGEYVGYLGATVNATEGFCSQLKRGINGTHIHVSPKHLPKYLVELEYRWNMRSVPHLMLDRLMVSLPR